MANAGCINAYDCNGCLIQTLQNLDSACIGVGVQYTAPNPLDDKRLDYIKYTDKCGCVQCLSAENEILIYATNGVIKNLTLTNDDVNEAIKIQWNDIFGSNRAKTIVRYKTGSYPVSITDGTLAVEETTKNQYSSTPFSLSGVLDETTYYITAFAVDSNGTIIDVQSNTITTDFVKFKLSTDFRNYSSLAQLQAVGWTGQTVMGGSPTISYGSSGVTISGNSYSYGGVYVELPFTINSSHKINMKFTGYLRGTNKCDMHLGSTSKVNLQNNNSYEIGYGQNSGGSRNDQGISSAKYINGTKYRGTFYLYRIQAGSEGEFSAEVQIDLPNNTIKWVSYAPNSQIGTMEGQLNTESYNTILSAKYFIVWMANYESPKSQNIYTAEITIK